jgi:hypothetical protein
MAVLSALLALPLPRIGELVLAFDKVAVDPPPKDVSFSQFATGRPTQVEVRK